MIPAQVDRRRILQATGAAAVLPVLTACSTGMPGTNDAETEKPIDSVLPTYTPREIIPADEPATESGVPAAYYAYPAEPVQVHDEPPAGGETITALNAAGAATVPPKVSNNPFWQELNNRLGATMEITYVPGPDLAQKVATIVAGAEIPDIMTLQPTTPRLDQMLAAKFQDLSKWVSGDAINNYPSLAALPTTSWKNMIYNDGIYGIPYSVPVARPFPTLRQDLLDETGFDTADVTDGASFVEMCKALTNPSQQRWAFGAIAQAQPMIKSMAGVPNAWLVENGTFTSAYATEEYKRYLEIMRDLVAEGLFHPDAASLTYGENRTMQIGGRVALSWTGYFALALWIAEGRQAKADFNLRGIVLPKWDGGGQATYLEESGQGAYFSAIRQMDDSRVETVLRILDWLATPFGSAEYEFVTYGEEGRHFTRGEDNSPIVNEQGTLEVTAMALANLARSYIPVFVPGDKETAKAEYNTMKQLLEVSEPLPTVGLQSATALKDGATINKNLGALEMEIILDRRKVSDWDAGVEEWQAAGGEQIAREYAESYANSAG